ncbi:MAG TPA: hypothetical protein VK846_07510 [Candidatus Limnocylindria bacterium]|nr:hypothetical protein [Candidatus Limnocylindria bacterium]
MKRIDANQRHESVTREFVRSCLNTCDAIRDAVARAKEAVLREYAHLAEEHGRVLRLALNEAEALAWQTDFPHLVFPALAAEKAQATVAWHRRERAVRGAAAELAFAE